MRTRQVVREAARLYGRNAARFLAIAFVFYAGLAALTALAIFVWGETGAGIAAPFWLGGIFWIQGAVAKAVEDVRREDAPRLSIRKTLERGAWTRVNALSAVSLLGFLALSAAVWLLVVPALVLAVRWSLVAPVIVLENAGTFRSFGRSSDLVRGASWRIFWLLLASVVVVVGGWIALTWSVGVQEDWLPAGDTGATVAFAIESVVYFTLLAPFFAIVATLVYYARREAFTQKPSERWQLRIGDVLDEAWELYATHPARLIAVAAGIFVPLAGLEFGAAAADNDAEVLAPIATLFGVILLPGVYAAGLEGGFERVGARAWLGDLRRRTAGKRVRMALASLVTTAAVCAGFVVIVVGSVVVLTFWSLVAIAVGAEDKSFRNAFSRSRELVSGRGFRVFLVLALSAVVAVLLVVLVSPVLPLVPLPGLIFGFVLAAVAECIAAPFIALSWVVTYRELRRMRDDWLARNAPPAAIPEPVAQP